VKTVFTHGPFAIGEYAYPTVSLCSESSPDESRHHFRNGLRHCRGRRSSCCHTAEHGRLRDLALADIQAFAPDALLAVTSTTGMGELPDDLMPLYDSLRDTLPSQWRGLPGGVIALGDSSYGDTYCGGGEQLRELYAELGVQEVVPMLRLDASETVDQETDAEPWLDDFTQALKG